MNWLTDALSAISTVLAVLGVYFCYQGRTRGRGLVVHYLMWFFSLTLIVRVASLIERLLLPKNPSYEWVAMYGVWLNRLSYAMSLFNQIAFAILVVGCYLAFWRTAKNTAETER